MNTNTTYPDTETTTSDADVRSTDGQKVISDNKSGEGLTDDQRVSREDDPDAEGARVTLGPVDEKRLSNSTDRDGH